MSASSIMELWRCRLICGELVSPGRLLPRHLLLSRQVRQIVEEGGGFILVHVSTPVEVCEQRDRKGLFAKARAGVIKEFTGVSDPYEEPDDADLVCNTTELSPEECVQEIILHLEKEGYIGPSGSSQKG